MRLRNELTLFILSFGILFSACDDTGDNPATPTEETPAIELLALDSMDVIDGVIRVCAGDTVGFQIIASSSALLNNVEMAPSEAVCTTDDSDPSQVSLCFQVQGIYQVRATSSLSGSSVSSDSIRVLVQGIAPEVLGYTSAIDVYKDSSFDLSISSTGSPPLFVSWYKNDSLIADSVGILYRVAAASHTDSGFYSFIVENDCGMVESGDSAVHVSVAMPPVIAIDLDPFDDFIQAGTINLVRGKVEVTNGVVDSFYWHVLDSVGNMIDTSRIRIPQTPNLPGMQNVVLEDLVPPPFLDVMPNACDGYYRLHLTVVSENESAAGTIGFRLVGGAGNRCEGDGGTPLETHMLGPIGAQSAMYGSSIDFDEGRVYTVMDARANSDLIDGVYAVTVGGEESIVSPMHAASLNLIFMESDATKSILMMPAAVDFGSISTKQQIRDLWVEEQAVSTTLSVTLGDTFIIMTSEGQYALAIIESQTSGTAGTITMKVKI